MRRPQKKKGPALLAAIHIADRWIMATFGADESARKKSQSSESEATYLKAHYDPGGPDMIREPLYPETNGEELESVLRKVLGELQKRAAPKKIDVLTIGCCVALRATATVDRNIGAPQYAGYGVIARNALHDSWKDVNLYDIACDEFQDIKDKIYVRADVSLGALGEFWWRLEKGSLASFDEEEILDQGLPLFLRNVTMSYLKLSADVNGAFVYHGNLFGGKNHPFMSIIRPRPFEYFDEEGMLQRDNFRGTGEFHNDCYSGMISIEALTKRKDVLDEASGRTDATPLLELPYEHEVWESLAYYGAQLCHNIIAMHVPSLIVLGGRLVTDHSNSDYPKNDIINRIWQYLQEELDCKVPEYPELQRPDGFLQPAECQWPSLYGGLIFGARHTGRDPTPLGRYGAA